jgi:hypothetical protein
MSSAISLLEATANMQSSMDARPLVLAAMILFASIVLPLIFFNWRVSSARAPLEVLLSEVEELKKQLSRVDGDLDMHYKSSCDETAVMREEIKQLKADLLWHQKVAAARWECESYDAVTEAEFNQNMPITSARRAERHLGAEPLRWALRDADKEMCKAAVIALRR